MNLCNRVTYDVEIEPFVVSVVFIRDGKSWKTHAQLHSVSGQEVKYSPDIAHSLTNQPNAIVNVNGSCKPGIGLAEQIACRYHQNQLDAVYEASFGEEGEL